MNSVVTQTSGAEYTPKYLFVSDDSQRGTGKSRHVMKEFLRKRDSLRRQNQLAARSQTRVLPWLRREHTGQPLPRIAPAGGDVGIPSDSLSDASSTPSSPRQSYCAAGSTMGESHSSPAFSTSESMAESCGPPDNSTNISRYALSLADYVHEGIINRLYETKNFPTTISPASAMANHLLSRPVASQILLAMSSLTRDIEAGQQIPSLETLALVVEGIRLLQQLFHSTDSVSDDAILAVITLWNYEALLAMGVTTEDDNMPKSVTSNIQTHLNGLQRSIECRGGLHNLSSETRWHLAWCVSTLPGYSPVDTRMVEAASSNRYQPQSGADGYYCLTRLFDTLANIDRNMSSPDFLSSILDEPSFSPLRKTLLRLHSMRLSLKDQKTPMGRLRKSTALTSSLLFIFDILLGGTDRAHQEARSRRSELLTAQSRLVQHGLDKEGSFEKAWSVLMTRQEVPSLELHHRAWSIVEMTNVVKHLNVSTIDALSKLLLGYLLPETRSAVRGDYQYERLLVQIHYELDGLADLG